MTTAFALSRYRQAEAVGQPTAADPHEVILVTLRELDRALAVLAAAADAGRKPPAEPTNKAFTALYILQSSLDFEKGGEIATLLFQLYEFTRLQVLSVFRGDGPAEIEAARAAIAEILGAWRSIRPETGVAPVAAGFR